MVKAELDPKDLKRFNDALQMLVVLSDKDVKDILRQQGRLFAVDMTRATERRGLTVKVGKKHKEDVEKTIKGIYINDERGAKLVSQSAGLKDGKRFYNWIRRGEFSKAQDMVDRLNIGARYFRGAKVKVGEFDGGHLHRKYRFKKHRKEIMIIQQVGPRNRYIKQEQKRVGLAKAGWADAAKDLGGAREIKAYVKKGHPRVGKGSVKGRGSKAVLMVRNSVKYIDSALKVADRTSVWMDRIKKMEKQIEFQTRAIQRKIKRKYRL